LLKLRPLQELGPAERYLPRPSQARWCRRWRQADGQYPHRRSQRWAVGCRGACQEALREGVHSADVIVNILARQRKPTAVTTVITSDALKLR
jgi:hypothetical protein